MSGSNQVTKSKETLSTITLIYPSLTKAEKKVADAIQSNPEEMVLATINDLAENAGVGETSVVRFCRKLGFKGYHDFKLSIGIDLVNYPTHMEEKISEIDDYLMVVRQMTQNNEKMIQEVLGMLNMVEIKKAVEVILSAKKIYIYGVVTSGTLALDILYRFMRIGLNVESSQESHIIAMTSVLIQDTDVVLGISTSGHTSDIIGAFQKAKESGAVTIAITSHQVSALAAYTDIQLLVPSKEMSLHQGGSFSLSTKIAQIHLVDILTTLITMEKSDTAYNSIKKTAKAVIDKMT